MSCTLTLISYNVLLMTVKRICIFLATLMILLSLGGLSLHADASEAPEQSQYSFSISDEPNDPAGHLQSPPTLPGFEIASTRVFFTPESHYLDPQRALPERPPCA